MQVTMAMLLDALSREHECVLGASYNPDLVVSGVVECSNRDLVVDEKGICVVIPPSYDERDHQLAAEGVVSCGRSAVDCAVEVLDACECAALREEVSSCLEWYRMWGSDLLDLSMHGAGLEELVDFAHGLFRNPITIIDSNYQVLAYTRNDVMDDYLWVSVSAPETLRRAQAKIDEDEFARFLNQVRTAGTIVGFKTGIGTLLTSCKVPGSDDSLVIVNVVHKNSSVTCGQLHCLEYLAKVIGAKMKMLVRTSPDYSGGYSMLLRDLASGKLEDAREQQARLDESWISVKPLFTVAAITSRAGTLKYYQLCRVEDELKGIVEQGSCVIHERMLFMFINHEADLTRGTLDAFERYLDENELLAGLSDSRESEYFLGDLVQQARLALDIARRVDGTSALTHYSSVRRCYLFTLFNGRDDWRRFLHPSLGQLEKYDRAARLQLLPTLERLAYNHGGRQDTAAELGIQRNTLQYRLTKIEELCAIDLSDEATIDHIEASFALRDFCRFMQGEGQVPGYLRDGMTKS